MFLRHNVYCTVYNDDMLVQSVAQKKITQSKNTTLTKRPRGRPREFDREEGLRRAMLLFWKLGYEVTSMADLRASLGITQASLYAAYGNKESLFREAVDLYVRTDGNTTIRALSRPGMARDAIHAMLQDAVDTFTAHAAPGGCLLVLGAINCTVENKAVQDHLAGLRQGTLETITRRLKQAQHEGEFSGDVHVINLAGYYAMVLHGLSVPARDGASREELTQIVNLAMTIWPGTQEEPREGHS